MTEIYLKSILVFALATLAAWWMRHRSSSARHLVWLGALTAALILPLGLLLPQTVFPISGALSVVAQSAGSTTGRSAVSPVTIWLLGSAILAIRLLIGVARTIRVVNRATPSSSAIRFTRILPAPAAWGLGRSLILLPEQAKTWQNERTRAVLLHEEAHLRRKDCWALLIAEIACAMYWCNPLVWLAASRLRLEQERAADDEVLNSGIDPAQYADHLVSIAKADRAPMLTAGAVHQSQLGIRIKSILDPRRDRTMASRKTLGIAVLLLSAIAIPLASMQAERKIYKVSDGGIVAPRVIHKEEPKYTQEARDAKIQGTAKLSGVVDVDGRLHDIQVKEGLDAGLDANAVTAAGTWRFEPAQKAGEPVPVAVTIEVHFRLL